MVDIFHCIDVYHPLILRLVPRVDYSKIQGLNKDLQQARGHHY